RVIGLALEVENDPVLFVPQDLPEMVVAVDADPQACAVEVAELGEGRVERVASRDERLGVRPGRVGKGGDSAGEEIDHRIGLVLHPGGERVERRAVERLWS